MENLDTTIRERTLTTPRHRTAYLESGPSGGPLMVFVHVLGHFTFTSMGNNMP